MFTVKLTARPDARMVEVPLEIDAELPREFEGAALLASSGLPRKVKIKAAKDSLKLSTAYRADQLVGDIVKSSLRGTAQDVERIQEAVTRFIRTVRERRQDGAALIVNSNGRGKFDVVESVPGLRGAAPAITPTDVPRLVVAPEKLTVLERRLSELESAFARAIGGGELADRVAQLEERLKNLMPQLARSLVAAEVAGPGMERERGAAVIARTPGGTRRATAVEAYAEGLRNELRARASAAEKRARGDSERCDRAAALSAEAELLGAPADGTTQRLRDAAAQAAARESALQRITEEIDLYEPADLPVAQQLVQKLEDGPGAPDPGPSLETVAQAVVRAAKGGDCKPRTAWLKRAAALCGWQLVEPARGSVLIPEWHQTIDSGGTTVVRLACPGVRRADGSGIVRARVHVDPAAASLPEEPDEPPAVPEPIAPPPPSPPHIPVSDEAGDEEEEVVEEVVATPSVPAPATAAAPDRAAEPAKAAEAAPDKSAALPLPPPGPAPAAAFIAPFGDLTGEAQIRPEEAAAAATAASRMPKIVADDPARSDEALAAEVALAVETEVTSDSDWAAVARGPEAFGGNPAGPDEMVGDADIEEVHELTEPLPDDEPPQPSEKKS